MQDFLWVAQQNFIIFWEILRHICFENPTKKAAFNYAPGL